MKFNAPSKQTVQRRKIFRQPQRVQQLPSGVFLPRNIQPTVMTRIAQRLKAHDHDILVLRKKITHILPRFIASIPYLLSQSLDEYLHIVQTGSSKMPTPNRPVGGLLLLHGSSNWSLLRLGLCGGRRNNSSSVKGLLGFLGLGSESASTSDDLSRGFGYECVSVYA